VRGYISNNNPSWSNVDFLEGGIAGYEVGFKNSPSPPVEIHHCFDLPKTGGEPLDLQKLWADLEGEGLQVRTWSLFDRPNLWSFRSTALVYGIGFAKRCQDDYYTLSHYLKEKGFNSIALWVVLEDNLGIWRAPLETCGEESHPNQVSVEALIGAPNTSIHLANLVSQCHEKETHGVSETDTYERNRITEDLSTFDRVVRTFGLEPILIELAVNYGLPAASRLGHPDPANRYFAAHIVSYLDTPSFHVLRGWQEAISRIVEQQGLQINPIVSHPETYKWAFLKEELREWVELAYYEELLSVEGLQGIRSSGEIPQSPQQVKEVLARAVSAQNTPANVGACRKVYKFNSDETPAPVYNTVRTLSQQFVSGLMKPVSSSRLSPSESAAILHVLYRLLSSCLLIVPFRWPPADFNGGGCLFVVLAPGPGMDSIESEQLKNIVLRLGWVMLRAAIEATCPDNSLSRGRAKPKPEFQRMAARNIKNLREALKAAKFLQPSERWQYIRTENPFLNDAKKDTQRSLKRALEGETFNPQKLSLEVFRSEYERSSKATLCRWDPNEEQPVDSRPARPAKPTKEKSKNRRHSKQAKSAK
jgi:hypothetical protein